MDVRQSKTNAQVPEAIRCGSGEYWNRSALHTGREDTEASALCRIAA
jgi:hypothetical protein